MLIERLSDARLIHALQLAASFAEQNQRLLAENIANIDTPDYQTRQLDRQRFQAELGAALRRAERSGAEQLELRDRQAATTAGGALVTTPATRPAQNILFHDGRNASLERLMTEAQANALEYQMLTRLLAKRFEGLLTAIRGRMA